MDLIEIDEKEAKVDRIFWCSGMPYHPPGYYATVMFKGTRTMTYLYRDEHPPTNPKETSTNEDT